MTERRATTATTTSRGNVGAGGTVTGADKQAGVGFIPNNLVQFGCELFDETAYGYCVKYVTTANNGAVSEQKTECIPTHYISGNLHLVGL